MLRHEVKQTIFSLSDTNIRLRSYWPYIPPTNLNSTPNARSLFSLAPVLRNPLARTSSSSQEPTPRKYRFRNSVPLAHFSGPVWADLIPG